MLNSMTITCTRFSKVPCFCPACTGTPATAQQPSGERESLTVRIRNMTGDIADAISGDPSQTITSLGTMLFECNELLCETQKVLLAKPAPSPDVG